MENKTLYEAPVTWVVDFKCAGLVCESPYDTSSSASHCTRQSYGPADEI